jgi:hypothetical protein
MTNLDDETSNRIVQESEYFALLEQEAQNKKNFRTNCWIIGGLMIFAIVFTIVLKTFNLQ